jgi:RNase P/RNase MRP subunit POP5
MVEINFGSSTSAAADVEVVSSLFSAAMGIIEAMERIRNRMMVAVVHRAIVNAGEERRRIIFIIV